MITFLAWMGCSPSLPTPDPNPLPRVEAVSALPAPPTLSRHVLSVLEAQQDAMLTARLGGVITQNRVAVGQAVAMNEPLVQLDPREARAQLALSQAAVADARVSLAAAASSLVRVEALGEGASVADRDRALVAVKRATAGLDAALAQEDLASLHLAYMTVRAPFGGIVSWRPNDVGETVGPGTPVVRIVDTSSLRVRIGLLEDEIWAADDPRSHYELTVGAWSGNARVSYVAPAADPRTLTWEVGLSLPADASLRPGMPVEVTAKLAAHTATAVIPIRAIDEGSAWIVEKGAAYERQLLVIQEDGANALVEGVHEGDLVIVRGRRALFEGQEVVVLGE